MSDQHPPGPDWLNEPVDDASFEAKLLRSLGEARAYSRGEIEFRTTVFVREGGSDADSHAAGHQEAVRLAEGKRHRIEAWEAVGIEGMPWRTMGLCLACGLEALIESPSGEPTRVSGEAIWRTCPKAAG